MLSNLVKLSFFRASGFRRGWIGALGLGGSAVVLSGTLLTDSPFMPPSLVQAQEPAAAAPAPDPVEKQWEWRGYFQWRDRWEFSLYDRQAKTSLWIGLGQLDAERQLEVLDFNLEEATLRVSYRGQEGVLAMKKEEPALQLYTMAHMARPTTPPAPPATFTPPLAPPPVPVGGPPAGPPPVMSPAVLAKYQELLAAEDLLAAQEGGGGVYGGGALAPGGRFDTSRPPTGAPGFNPRPPLAAPSPPPTSVPTTGGTGGSGGTNPTTPATPGTGSSTGGIYVPILTPGGGGTVSRPGSGPLAPPPSPPPNIVIPDLPNLPGGVPPGP